MVDNNFILGTYGFLSMGFQDLNYNNGIEVSFSND